MDKSELLPYQNLVNAVIKQAVSDYQILISDDLSRKMALDATVNKQEIRAFLKDCHFHERILRIVEEKYKYEFVPYVNVHAQQIIDDWNRIDAEKMTGYMKNEKMGKLHSCPMCGGTLKPYAPLMKGRKIPYRYIGCSGCMLSANIPEGVNVDAVSSRARLGASNLRRRKGV